MENEAITKNDLRRILGELGMPFSPLDYYPVGAYFETSDTSFDPNNAWGGTWVLELEGQVHVSAGSNWSMGKANNNNGVGENDGGSRYIQKHHHSFTNPTYNSASVAHTHAAKPSNYSFVTSYAANWYATARLAYTASVSSGGLRHMATQTNGDLYVAEEANTAGMSANATHSHSVNTNGSVGALAGVTAGLEESSTVGNMPPYIIVNRWHRTA